MGEGSRGGRGWVMSLRVAGSFSPWRVVGWLLTILALAAVALVAAAAALLYTVGSMFAGLGAALAEIGAALAFIAGVLAAVLLMLVLTTPLLPFAPWVRTAGAVVMMLAR